MDDDLFEIRLRQTDLEAETALGRALDADAFILAAQSAEPAPPSVADVGPGYRSKDFDARNAALVGAVSESDYTIRVVGVYATQWRYPRPDTTANTGARAFAGTRLAAFGAEFGDLRGRVPLPLPIRSEEIGGTAIEFRARPDAVVKRADVILFALPSDQVVAAVTFDCQTSPVSDDPTAAAELLDEFAESRFTVLGYDLEDYLFQLVPDGIEAFDRPSRSPRTGRRHRPSVSRRPGLSRPEPAPELPRKLVERHLMVFVPDRTRLALDTVEQLLYRRNPHYWREFSTRKDPIELNERGRLGVVTNNVTFLHAQDALSEDRALLAAVQAVGTQSRFRRIWELAYDEVRQFQAKQVDGNATQTRDSLERLVDELGNLEFDLTFSVEFPLRGVESYDSALSEALDLDGQASRLSRMFSQLGGSVQSEIAAIDSRREREDSARQRRVKFAFNALAATLVPLGALLAFFGINTTSVNPGQSIFDWNSNNWWYYVVIGLWSLPLAVSGLGYLVARWRHWSFRRGFKRINRATEPLAPQPVGRLTARAILALGRVPEYSISP
jgi:hypothetical protein